MNDITIKTASDIQLHNMVRRLRLEREAQQLILSIRRATKGDSEFDYLDSGVSTEEKISNLYHSGMIDPSDEFLEHFGVLGMKWGVRKDKDRVGKSGAKKDGAIKRHLKKKYALNSDSKKELKEVEGKPKKTLDDKAMDYLKKKRAERVKNKNKISKMSDTELRQKINRLQMEKQYAQLTGKDKTIGVKVVNSVLGKIGNKVADRVIDRTIIDPIDDFFKGRG